MDDTSIGHRKFRTDTNGEMTIEWDVPIEVDDGIVLRADVFRPTSSGRYPTIMSYGPYGKGRPFQELLPSAWQRLVEDHPEVLRESSGRYQVFELADPERWVPDGYVCVRVDSRGTGRSPGRLDPLSRRETRDLYECIEWAAAQSWSNGRVGLNGISYYAINQWQVAALQPPHLSAVCVWEGAGDWYRDIAYHGGILSTFIDRWYAGITQYGVGEKGGRSPLTGQLVCGDVTLTDAELDQQRVDVGATVRSHPLFDSYQQGYVPDWSRITVPLLSAGNWGGLGLHLRGNTHGFELAASEQKWLTMHDDTHWSLFYTQYGLDLQKQFFGHFLKGEDTGWGRQPKVHLRTRHVDGRTGERVASDWPLPQTEWTRLHLDAGKGSMGAAAPTVRTSASYLAGRDRLSFSYSASEDIELAGPVAAKLFLESATADADVFLVLRAFSPDGTEVVYRGANDPHTPITQGWLRASHRRLDEQRSRPFLPVHRHDRAEPLIPGEIYELDVELWPTSLILPAGYALVLDVQGHDYVHPGASAPFTGSGPFLHNDGADRPASVFSADVTIHTGGAQDSYLLLPVIPPPVQPSAE